MDFLFKMAGSLYAYCTDFTINAANMLGLSYFEINAFLFVILWPAVTVILLISYLILKIRLNNKKSEIQKLNSIKFSSSSQN